MIQRSGLTLGVWRHGRAGFSFRTIGPQPGTAEGDGADAPGTSPPRPQALGGPTMLHLLYGFAYDCCLLDYQVVSDSEVRVIEMTPRRPTGNWPYEDYPEHFAVRPVALRDRKPISDKQMTRLTWQGLDAEAADQLILVVRPSDSFGVSLWGESGDAEEVEVVFCVSPETGRVSASNQCT
jgi:hypothetical protein